MAEFMITPIISDTRSIVRMILADSRYDEKQLAPGLDWAVENVLQFWVDWSCRLARFVHRLD